MRLIVLALSSLIYAGQGFTTGVADPLNLTWIDAKIPIQQNFYAYANGTWQRQHPIPADYASWSVFHELYEKNLHKIQQILQTAAANKQAAPDSIEQKVGDFYFSGMNEEQINNLGITPLASELARINAIQTYDQLPALIAHLHSIGVNVLFSFGSMTDFADSTQRIAAIMQGGLSLPDRDYYLKKDKKFAAIRTAYKQHITNMLILSGEQSSKAMSDANLILSIETTLAKSSLSQTAQRDPHAIYHPMRLADVEKISPVFSWKQYTSSLKHSEIDQVNLGMPSFIADLQTLIKSSSIDDLKVYLRWHLLNDYASYLSKPFVDEHFKMTKALTGAQKLTPRWKRVVDTEDWALGFAVGEIYVKNYFSPAAKQDVLKIITSIRQALRNDLKSLSWMSPSTRKAAINKLDRMAERVGYPD